MTAAAAARVITPNASHPTTLRACGQASPHAAHAAAVPAPRPPCPPERRRRSAAQACQHSCRAPPACGLPLSARCPCPGAARDVGGRPALLLGERCRKGAHCLRCVWRYRHHPARKDRYFPFKRSEIGAETPSRIVCGRVQRVGSPVRACHRVHSWRLIARLRVPQMHGERFSAQRGNASARSAHGDGTAGPARVRGASRLSSRPLQPRLGAP
jgi:hypothetical protein